MGTIKKSSGFTIVELLIVIVVIGILAAITIVAYNGIQQRARNTQVINGVNTYVKALMQYAAINSAYPTAGPACLGASYPADQCWTGDSGLRGANSALDTQLATVLGNKPVLATSLFSIGIGNNMRAGAVWDAATTKIIYYLQGVSQNCGIAGATGINEGSLVTQCAVTLPAV